ncbi:MAG: hypothetical protein IKV57_03610 [Clostridia bacterium]|nr:hypothetical protein [Clostridia bacterium]
MKKVLLTMVAICALFAGCGSADSSALTVTPLPDTTMENMNDAILSISLEEGGAYVDDTGAMQMDVRIYTYDKYDMVDISKLNVGDVIVTTLSGEVKITSLERTDSGLIIINGGLEEGGFDLFTNNSGIYYETGFNDAKSWYEVGEATIRVSADFKGTDNSNPDLGEVILYPGDFLVGAVTDYNFTPYNTTIRVEGGQIVEMNRIFMP